jgi:hypothetical protein
MMSEQQKSDDAKEPLMPEQEKSEATTEGAKEAERKAVDDAKDANERLLPVPQKSVSTELSSPEQLNAAATTLPSHGHETEWIPGERLELVRIPHPTVWPVTLALGITGMAFGVVTQWILSLAGLFLFLLGTAGWIEDLRKDVLQ